MKQDTMLLRATELATQLATTQSAIDTLATWCGAPTLELSRVRATKGHKLTDQERRLLNPEPGRLYGYSRSSLLHTPRPDRRPVAWVNATVLLCRLAPATQEQVLDAHLPLGQVLLGTGAHRITVEVSTMWSPDWVGEPIAVRSVAIFRDHNSVPVAVVDENVYEQVLAS